MEVAQVPTDWPEEEVGARSAPIDLVPQLEEAVYAKFCISLRKSLEIFGK